MAVAQFLNGNATRYVFLVCGQRHVSIKWTKYARIRDDEYVLYISPGGGTGGEVCRVKLHLVSLCNCLSTCCLNLALKCTLRFNKYPVTLFFQMFKKNMQSSLRLSFGQKFFHQFLSSITFELVQIFKIKIRSSSNRPILTPSAADSCHGN